MALIVLDASIAIAHLDGDDAHHAATEILLRECRHDDLVLPMSAYSETLVVPARRGRLEGARASLALLLLRLEPLTATIAERAAELRGATGSPRLPDALVLATGEELDADAVLTTDRRWSRFPRVRLVT